MNPVLAVKFRNAIQNSNPAGDYTFFVKNIVVNGMKRGCSGFVRNNENKTCVYVNTERSCLASLKNYMYRYADHERDFTGYRNRFADTLEELVRDVIALLQSSPVEARDCRI